MNAIASSLRSGIAEGGQRLLNSVRNYCIWLIAASMQFFAPSAVIASTFAADCAGCHAVSGARVNAANAGAVITAANTANGMGLTAGQLAAVGTYATEITSLLGGASIFTGPTRTVAYQSSANSITVPNVVVTPGSNVISSYGGSATNGSVGGVGTTALTYTHTANHCGSDTVVAFGQGLANTASRFIPITITPPTITAPSPTVNLSYSTGAQNVALGVTANVSGISITGAPANGTAGVVNTNTLSYAADATTYKAQVTIGYRGEGPGYGTANSCGSSLGTATVNVGLPPAPTVSNIGTLTVSSASPTNIDVSASISGVVASNPAATYAVVASQPTAGGSGTSSVSGNIITYTPAGGFSGTTTITYTKTGPGGISNTGTITLTVPAASTVVAASATTAYNTPVSINLASSITSSTTVTAVTPSAQTNGVAVQTGPTTVQFTPTNGFFGQGTFLYTATNGGGTSGTALVTVTVNPPAPTVSAATATVPYNTATAINLASFIGPVGATVLSVTPSGAVGGTAVATGPSTITFTPTSGAVGAASFNYSATNAGGTSAGTAAVSVTISAPVGPGVGAGAIAVVAASTSTAYNTPVSINLAGSITTSTAVTAVTPSAQTNGVAVQTGPTTIQFTPANGFFGLGTFLYTATDVGGTSGTALVTVTVNPPAPTLSAATATVPYNTATAINLASFIGPVGATVLSVTPSGAVGGTAVATGPSTITFTPTPGTIGAASFNYSATNVGGTSGTALVTVTVNPPAPTVSAATATVPYNTAMAINLASFIGPAGATVLSVTPSGAVGGTAVATGPSTITFTPTSGTIGAASFNYSATNVGGTSGTALVTVTVNPPPPTVSAASATVPFNTATAINLASSIGPVGATVLSVTPSGAVGGTAVATGPSTITFTPTSGVVGAASFNYSATNAGGTSVGTAVVSLTISAPAAPTASSGSINVFSNGSAAIALSTYITGTFTSASIFSPPSNGVAMLSGTTVTYTPNAGYLGADSFAFIATGPGGTSNIGTISIVVGAIPTTPAISRSMALNKTLTIDVSGLVTGSFTGITLTQPANGTASVSGNVITYVPKQDFAGKDSFTYTAVGGPVNSSPGTITVDVLPLPTAQPASLTVLLNTPSNLDLKAQLTGTAISGVIVGTAPQHGTVKVAGTTVTYTPETDYFGSDSFTYLAVDSIAGNSLPATVSVTVLPELPTVTPVTLTVAKNSSGSFNLLSYISGSAISGISIDALPKQGTVNVAGTVLTYTPKPGFFGQDAFTFIAYGAAGKSTPGSVKVIVTGEPDPTQDATVNSAVNSQVLAAMGMARGQVANFYRHFERSSRGRARASVGQTSPGSGPAPASFAAGAAAPFVAGQPVFNQPSSTLGSPLPNATHLPQGNAPASLPLATGISIAANDLGIAGSPLYALASGLIQNRSIDLGAVHQAFAGNTSAPAPESTQVWVEGVASFGVRDASGGISGANFSSTGITVGMDRIINEKLTVGLGAGYAQDTTNIGTDGSRSQSKGYSLAVYGSYMPGDNLFVEGLLGVGGFDFDTRRYVQPMDDFALSARKGYQYFGSIGGGYEWRGKTTMLSPYARLEFSSDRLGESSETGASNYALTYFEQTAASMQGVLGLRAESIHATPFGFAVPRARLEWRQDLRESSEAAIAYATQVGGTRYAISPTGSLRSALVWGIGSEFMFRDGWSLGLDYQLSRVSASESSFALRVKVTKELGAKGLPKLLQGVELDFNDDSEVQVDTGYTWDDNITRGKVAGDILVDNLYTLNVSKTMVIGLGSTSRLLLTAAAGGERFQNFNGLSKYTLTGEAAYQYRGSAEFDAATWGLFAKVTGEEYQSELRDGYRYSLGMSVLQPLTDRMTLSGTLSANGRRARSEVFRTMDSSARFNLDYALGRGATLYLGAEYRKGDMVSTGLASLENVSIAKLLVVDDAFDAGRFTSYRLDASTWLTTLGYNVGLGARDSIDLSWRRVQSTPALRPGWANSPTSYFNNQFSVSYLMRF